MSSTGKLEKVEPPEGVIHSVTMGCHQLVNVKRRAAGGGSHSARKAAAKMPEDVIKWEVSMSFAESTVPQADLMPSVTPAPSPDVCESAPSADASPH